MANALYVLRNFVLNGRLSEVIEDGDHIVFGEVGTSAQRDVI